MYFLLFIFDFYHKSSKQIAFVVVLTVVSSYGEFRMKNQFDNLKVFQFFFYIVKRDLPENCFKMHKAYNSRFMDQFLSLGVHANNREKSEKVVDIN